MDPTTVNLMFSKLLCSGATKAVVNTADRKWEWMSVSVRVNHCPTKLERILYKNLTLSRELVSSVMYDINSWIDQHVIDRSACNSDSNYIILSKIKAHAIGSMNSLISTTGYSNSWFLGTSDRVPMDRGCPTSSESIIFSTDWSTSPLQWIFCFPGY